MGPDALILVFWMLSFKPTFLLSALTFIKRLFSSSLLSAIRMVSSAYLRLLIFLPAILIPACASSSPVFLMMYSAYKSWYMQSFVCALPRLESLFPPVLWKSCNQIPLAFKVWYPGDSQSLYQIPRLGSLTWGSEPSQQQENFFWYYFPWWLRQ